MSEPKLALKFFKVKRDQLDDYGRLKPEAELLPFYGENHKTVDKIGVARDLVSPGTNVYRKVQVKNGDLTSSNVGQDKWHGGSAYGYAKGDEHYINSDDPYGLNGMPQGRNSSPDDPLYTSYINTNNDFKDTEEQAKTYFELIEAYLNRNKGNIHEYSSVPIIMLASDDDIIKYNDLLNNNFDAWRDDSICFSPQHEVQLKRAIPMRQITMDDISKYKMPLDLGNYDDYLKFVNNLPLNNKESKILSYVKNKFLDKYPEYTGISNEDLGDMLGIPYISIKDVSEDGFNKYKKKYNNGIYDPDYVMRNIFPADDKSTISDEQYKNILKAVYMDIPEHKKRQKNISNTLVDISRF